MTTSNSLKNKCPICNEKLTMFNRKYACEKGMKNSANGDFFFTSHESLMNIYNIQFHLYIHNEAIQYIKVENGVVNEIFCKDSFVHLNFKPLTSPAHIKGIALNFFNNVKTYDEAFLKLNKVAIFS